MSLFSGSASFQLIFPPRFAEKKTLDPAETPMGCLVWISRNNPRISLLSFALRGPLGASEVKFLHMVLFFPVTIFETPLEICFYFYWTFFRSPVRGSFGKRVWHPLYLNGFGLETLGFLSFRAKLFLGHITSFYERLIPHSFL